MPTPPHDVSRVPMSLDDHGNVTYMLDVRWGTSAGWLGPQGEVDTAPDAYGGNCLVVAQQPGQADDPTCDAQPFPLVVSVLSISVIHTIVSASDHRYCRSDNDCTYDCDLGNDPLDVHFLSPARLTVRGTCLFTCAFTRRSVYLSIYDQPRNRKNSHLPFKAAMEGSSLAGRKRLGIGCRFPG